MTYDYPASCLLIVFSLRKRIYLICMYNCMIASVDLLSTYLEYLEQVPVSLVMSNSV